ncbi:hypothetical protein RF11_10236 [Thelohanellus kitauei]|uniref:Uncharacterized protein n=1 Tax=Thelohanellus kitauei TaxID=669202 RepID=A0A0C2J273_THEKT|nr:hypothetical protein RF11_10236 [Thelohanellus kitauei]
MDLVEQDIFKSGSKRENEKENQEAIDYYINKLKCDLPTQREAVLFMMNRFLEYNDPKIDQLFIELFPDKLLLEFRMMGGDMTNLTNFTRFQDNIDLFFLVITFLFRNQNLVTHGKAILLFELFIKLTKIKCPVPFTYPDRIIDSIINCLSYEPNQILFIHENGALNYFTFFNTKNYIHTTTFWTLCDRLYSLKRSSSSLLCRDKLKENLNHIITIFNIRYDENCAAVIFTFLRMLCRLRLLEEIELDIDHLYNITVNEIWNKTYTSYRFYPKYFPFLSKIWSGIFNRSRNNIQIESINELVVFGAIFSIGVANKLRNLGMNEEWELTKNEWQRWYIIYFTLVAFPIINHTLRTWLHNVLTELHDSLKGFFEIRPINLHNFTSKYIIVQYYIKSIVTLEKKIIPLEIYAFKSFFAYFENDPLLALHKSCLSSHFMYAVKNRLEFSEVYLAKNPAEFQSFIKSLIIPLSDERLTSRLQEQKETFLNEYLKSSELALIKDDFFKSVFSKCANHLSKTCIDKKPDDSDYAQCKIFKQVFTRIVVSLNESYIMDKDTVDSCLALCQIDMRESSKIQPIQNNSLSISQFLEDSKNYKNVSFSILLKWFTLIYELKFIFGDTNSKFDNLNLARLI